eukprot:Em0001g2589a
MRKQYGLKEIENPLFQSQQMYIGNTTKVHSINIATKTITGSQTTTLGALQHDSQFDIRLEELTTSDTVQEFKAVIFKDSTVVNLGEFIELVTPYDQLLSTLLLAPHIFLFRASTDALDGRAKAQSGGRAATSCEGTGNKRSGASSKRRRKQREQETREAERRQREEEKQRQAERERQARDEWKAQFEMVARLAQDGRNREGEQTGRILKEAEAKMAKLTERDDIEAYLATFERTMTAYEVNRQRWVYKLAPHNVRVRVRERKPTTCLEAGQLADDYAQARRQTGLESKREDVKNGDGRKQSGTGGQGKGRVGEESAGTRDVDGKVGKGTVRLESSKIEAIKRMPVPKTKKGVRQFLGLAGYRRFIRDFATIATSLTELTRKSAPQEVKWSLQAQEAFDTLKTKIASSPVLMCPDMSRMFTLQTDASDYGIGTVLSQTGEDGEEHPVAFISQKLLPRERRYSTIEKECLTIRMGTQAFRVYLIGKPFVVQTDHRALEWLYKMKDTTSRLTRWSLALQPFQFTVRYCRGQANANADALSRCIVSPSEATKMPEEGEVSGPQASYDVSPSQRVVSGQISPEWRC